MITPWPFQKAAVEAVYSYFTIKDGNPIIAMPTGTGKSIVICSLLRDVVFTYANQRVIVLTHVKELIEQNYSKLLSYWPTAPAGVFSAGLNRREARFPITFAGIASVYKQARLFGFVDLVIVDECHLISPKAGTMYGAFLADLRKVNPDVKTIGLSATPYRLGLGHITDGTLFTDVCYDLTSRAEFNQLVMDGYLAPLIPKRTDAMLDVSNVSVRGGEFVNHELQEAVDKDHLTRAAVDEMALLGQDRRHWLIFASGINHAEHVVAALWRVGISAIAVHSKLEPAVRDEAIAGFRQGKYRAIVNNNILTTGFDFPPIDMIGMLRPTSSPSLWVQMLGRGTRPSPGKVNCLVLDFARNTRRLGPINDPVLPKKKGAGGHGSAPVKACPQCHTYNHASAATCVFCATEFPRQLKINTTASQDEVMVIEAPVVSVFRVDRVTYARHNKPGSPPSIRVSYFCGLRQFKEWVCLEHSGLPRRNAKKWWEERAQLPAPDTVDMAFPQLPSLRVPTHLRVWVNRKYPEILAYDFTGTSFGQQGNHTAAT